MGSPFGSIFVNCFLKAFESKYVDNDHNKLSIQLWKRYVDDAFAIVKINDAKNILKYLNHKHEAIIFKMGMAEQSR